MVVESGSGPGVVKGVDWRVSGRTAEAERQGPVGCADRPGGKFGRGDGLGGAGTFGPVVGVGPGVMVGLEVEVGPGVEVGGRTAGEERQGPVGGTYRPGGRFGRGDRLGGARTFGPVVEVGPEGGLDAGAVGPGERLKTTAAVGCGSSGEIPGNSGPISCPKRLSVMQEDFFISMGSRTYNSTNEFGTQPRTVAHFL